MAHTLPFVSCALERAAAPCRVVSRRWWNRLVA